MKNILRNQNIPVIMTRGSIFPTKTRKIFVVIGGIATAAIIIPISLNVIGQTLDVLFTIGYIGVGLLSIVLINRYEKTKQINKLGVFRMTLPHREFRHQNRLEKYG